MAVGTGAAAAGLGLDMGAEGLDSVAPLSIRPPSIATPAAKRTTPAIVPPSHTGARPLGFGLDLPLSRSSKISRAFAYRSAGSFRKQRRITRSTAGGIAAFFFEGGAGSSRSIAASTFKKLAP
jgi:hypothetical protein